MSNVAAELLNFANGDGPLDDAQVDMLRRADILSIDAFAEVALRLKIVRRQDKKPETIEEEEDLANAA